MLRCYGSIMRTYRHEPSGTLVTMAVMFGPRGPIAVHTPEICYRSKGTRPTRDRLIENVATSNQEHQLWSVAFAQNDDPEPVFEVWYAWSTGGPWLAGDYPRFWLTDDLYKIQLSGPVAESGFDPCESFVDALLPQLEQLIE